MVWKQRSWGRSRGSGGRDTAVGLFIERSLCVGHFRCPPNYPRWGCPCPTLVCQRGPVKSPAQGHKLGGGGPRPGLHSLRSEASGTHSGHSVEGTTPTADSAGSEGSCRSRPLSSGSWTRRCWRPRARLPSCPGPGGAAASSAEPDRPTQAMSRPRPLQGLGTCFLFQPFLASGRPRGTGTAASVCVCLFSRPRRRGPGRPGSLTDLRCLAEPSVGAGTGRGGVQAGTLPQQPWFSYSPVHLPSQEVVSSPSP